MARISVNDAKAWTEGTKLTVTAIDADLEGQVSSRVLSAIEGTYETGAWTDVASTPVLVRSVISMLYIAWQYDRAYSTGEEPSAYAALLRGEANNLLEGIATGVLELEEVEDEVANLVGQPSFEETEPVFLMGSVW